MNRYLLASMAVLGLVAGTSTTWAGEKLTGKIETDGSSTVMLITKAMAVYFEKQHPGVKVSVGVSGTGGGFKKFAAGETDISNASRAITPAEKEACKKNGIDYVELQVGWDGLAVVIHPENTWATKMTMEQLKKIWHPGIAAKNWSDVDPSWPNEKIQLFGPGPASGTFDYFTEAVNGKERVSRRDFSADEDDNVLVQGVAGNKYALGYFGVAYYEQNSKKLGIVALSAKGKEAVLPTRENVLKRTYPLSRPLFIYVKKSSLLRPEVESFARFYLRRDDLVKIARYIELTTRQRNGEQDKLEKAVKAGGS